MVVLALRQALDAVARADDAQLARELVVAVGGRAVGRRACVARLDEDLGGRAVDRRGVEVARPHREEVRDVVVREGDVELGARLERAPVVVLAREREDAVVRVELRDAVRAAPVRRRNDRAAQRLAAGAAGEVRPRVPLHLEVDDGVAAVEDRRADLHEDGRGRREVRVGRLDEAARRQRAGQARRLARHPDDRRPREAPLAVAEAVPRRDAHVVLDARQQRRVRRRERKEALRCLARLRHVAVRIGEGTLGLRQSKRLARHGTLLGTPHRYPNRLPHAIRPRGRHGHLPFPTPNHARDARRRD